jgi:hypothetical protein
MGETIAETPGETGTGQQIVRLHDSLMMMMMIMTTTT